MEFTIRPGQYDDPDAMIAAQLDEDVGNFLVRVRAQHGDRGNLSGSLKT